MSIVSKESSSEGTLTRLSSNLHSPSESSVASVTRSDSRYVCLVKMLTLFWKCLNNLVTCNMFELGTYVVKDKCVYTVKPPVSAGTVWQSQE